MRSVAVIAACALAVLGLAGCTAPTSPDPVQAAPSALPSATADPAAIPPIAVVTIAAVDVDGATATVAGYVTQVSEDGGTCEFRLEPAFEGDVVVVDATPAANIGTTSCGTVQVPTASLAKGTWTVVLTYTSTSLDITSEPVTMEVP